MTQIHSHTPGLWASTATDDGVIVHGHDGIPICRMGGNVSQVNVAGNAALIAAAPDMLAALVWLADEVESLANQGRASHHVLKGARAAIAKATGGAA